MMKKYLLAAALCLWSGLAGATCTTLPFVFSTGLIFSSQVNSNFSYLGGCAAAAGANSDITSTSALATMTNVVSIGGTYVTGVANGGTGATSLTAHGVVTGGTGTVLGSTAAGAANSVLTGAGASDPVYSTMTALLDTVFGSTRGMILKRGASTWGVLALGASGQCLASNGTDPLYQNCSAAGVTEPTLTSLTSGTGTYTTPAGATRLWVRLVAPGGGGGGSTGAGGVGADTTFGTTFLVAGHGLGGAANGGAGGVGGSASGGDLNLAGSTASPGCTFASSVTNQNGSSGAPGLYGAGAGAAGIQSVSSGGAGAAGTGAGGGGSANDGTHGCGGPGGAGGYVEKLIVGPLATYAYAIGTGGAAGTGASNLAGGAGGSSQILVTAYYD